MRTGGRPLACRQSFWRFSASSRGTGPRFDEPEPAADRVAAALSVEWPAPQAPAGADLAAAEDQLAADRVAAARAAVAARAVTDDQAEDQAADRAGTAAAMAGAMVGATAGAMVGATAVINWVSLR
jgi:hypothetical protein